MTSAIATRIAIIGAGFSGSLLAVQLLRRFAPRALVYLIEKNAAFGRGLAYSTGNPNHVLNVRASRMSAFVDQPDHFADWLRRSAIARTQLGIAADQPDIFVPRQLYGRYIQELLGDGIWQTGKGKNLFLVSDEAVALHQRGEGLSVELQSGRRHDVDAAVLAMGNFPNENAADHYFGNPWSPGALAGLDSDAAVLLIGTGLTMVDTVISLLDQGHRGPIHAVSRRGLLPRRHGAAPPHAGYADADMTDRSIVDLLRLARHDSRAADPTGEMWRSVVDGLRPHTQSIWLGWSDTERRRFLRHLRPWWEAHRHRMAPQNADVIDAARCSGQLVVRAGRVHDMLPDKSGVTVGLRMRGSGKPETLRVARVVDCSGPQYDLTRIDNPLVRQLLAAGIARPDPFGLGLDVTPDSAVINRWGAASRRLYALGPVTRGTFWEITSVPDIRQQCWDLAGALAAEAGRRDPVRTTHREVRGRDIRARLTLISGRC